MVDLTGNTSDAMSIPDNAIIVLTAAMFAIVVWATGAWWFGIPTSESHSLIAGLTGGALALGGFEAVNAQAWIKVGIGLGVSSVLGFFLGVVLVRIIERIVRYSNRFLAERVFHKLQVAAAALMAFLHGAQDGQKFMGVFMLALFLNGSASKAADGTFVIPLWVMVLCSLVMGLGTMVGGKRIIKTVGIDMVKMRTYQGFASDLAASTCLLIASLTGLPVSTTHTKTTAVMGVAASRRVSSVDWAIAREMVWAWVLTFPGCGLLGFAMAKLFLFLF
jgi:PiT family inorganic phosphate transporter